MPPLGSAGMTGSSGCQEPAGKGVVDLGQSVLAVVREQPHGLGSGQFLGRRQVARGQLDLRQLETDLGNPGAFRILVRGGTQRRPGRVPLAGQPFGDGLEVTEIGPLVAVLGRQFSARDRTSSPRRTCPPGAGRRSRSARQERRADGGGRHRHGAHGRRIGRDRPVVPRRHDQNGDGENRPPDQPPTASRLIPITSTSCGVTRRASGSIRTMRCKFKTRGNGSNTVISSSKRVFVGRCRVARPWQSERIGCLASWFGSPDSRDSIWPWSFRGSPFSHAEYAVFLEFFCNEFARLCL